MKLKLYTRPGFIFLLIVFASIGCNLKNQSAQNKKVENLRAFAKLYGYTRYFHPSDQADSINWNQFVIYGSRRVIDAKDIQDLKTDLEELFLPIAPTLQLYYSGTRTASNPLTTDTTGLKVVAWQHLGFGRKDGLPPYRSIRTNRPAVITDWDFMTKEIFTGLLFEKIPGISESINKKLAGNLFCLLPLALYSDSAGTLPHTDKLSFKILRDSLEKVNLYSLTADDESVRVADIIIAWNIFQHFYSYFDVIGADWDKELTYKLRQALTDRNGFL
jgi:hypothetical protein